MWNHASTFCEQGMSQPPANVTFGMPYQKVLGILQGS